MDISEIILISIALSVDSMAVSLSGSVAMGKINLKKVSSVALILAIVQTGFLLAGFYAGETVSHWIDRFESILGMLLLFYVGIDMIVEAIRNKKDKEKDFSNLSKIFIAAVATSIDAVTCGASFGLIGLSGKSIVSISACTFAATAIFSIIGLECGHIIGDKGGRPAKIIAGLVLILLGVEVILL